MYRLTKKFRFEAAHRLAKGYTGKCANIHGHSWNGELTVECTELDKFSFGIDFVELKKLLNNVETLYDHAILLYIEDKELIKLCKDNEWKHSIFSENPTSEVIANVIFKAAKEYFSDKEDINSAIKVHSVTIEETCTSRCEYYELKN